LAKGVKPFELGVGGDHLGGIVLLGGGRTGVTSIMFCAHLPEHMSEGYQAFLPYDDGVLSAVKLLSRARSSSYSLTITASVGGKALHAKAHITTSK
jgi:hypothetical protein